MADQKITTLPEMTEALAANDVYELADVSAGTAGSKKITHANLRAAMRPVDVGVIITCGAAGTSGYDFTGPDAVKDALASFSDESSTKRYLLLMGPGTFNAWDMTDRTYITVRGSGVGATRVLCRSAAASAGGTDFVNVTGTEFVILEDISFELTTDAATTVEAGAVQATNRFSYLRIDNCYFVVTAAAGRTTAKLWAIRIPQQAVLASPESTIIIRDTRIETNYNGIDLPNQQTNIVDTFVIATNTGSHGGTVLELMRHNGSNTFVFGGIIGNGFGYAVTSRDNTILRGLLMESTVAGAVHYHDVFSHVRNSGAGTAQGWAVRCDKQIFRAWGGTLIGEPDGDTRQDIESSWGPTTGTDGMVQLYGLVASGIKGAGAHGSSNAASVLIDNNAGWDGNRTPVAEEGPRYVINRDSGTAAAYNLPQDDTRSQQGPLEFHNVGTDAYTINRNGGTINGATSDIVLPAGQTAMFVRSTPWGTDPRASRDWLCRLVPSTLSGGGDVSGPGSSTANTLVQFADGSGKTIAATTVPTAQVARLDTAQTFAADKTFNTGATTNVLVRSSAKPQVEWWGEGGDSNARRMFVGMSEVSADKNQLLFIATNDAGTSPQTRLRVLHSGGLIVGSPTAGTMADGVINCTAILVNGSPISAGGGDVSTALNTVANRVMVGTAGANKDIEMAAMEVGVLLRNDATTTIGASVGFAATAKTVASGGSYVPNPSVGQFVQFTGTTATTISPMTEDGAVTMLFQSGTTVTLDAGYGSARGTQPPSSIGILEVRRIGSGNLTATWG